MYQQCFYYSKDYICQYNNLLYSMLCLFHRVSSHLLTITEFIIFVKAGKYSQIFSNTTHYIDTVANEHS